MHLPVAVGRLGDVAYAGVRVELRAVAHRVREVGECDGVLGADVAAAAAVAAARAAGLLDAGDVDVGIEAHGDRRRDDVVAERGAGRLERLVFRILAGARVALRVQPELGAAEAFIEQAVLRDLAGPALVGEHARVRAQRHAGIDQRAAAEAAADQHMHVISQAYVEQRRRRAGAQALARHLHLVLQVGKAAREGTGEHLAPAFQHGDRLAGARQPRCRHAATIARADDDDVVAVADMLERARQAGHALILVADFQLTDFTQPSYGAAARIDTKNTPAARRQIAQDILVPANNALIPPDLSI